MKVRTRVRETVTMERIGPEKAREYLGMVAEGQRKLCLRYAERLAKEMREGRWQNSSDAIVFVNDKLVNGQNRLKGIVISGLAQTFIVLRTNNENIYEVLDCGRRRSYADVLYGKKVEHGDQISAAAGMVLGYKKGVLNLTTNGVTNTSMITRGDILDYVNENLSTLQEYQQFVDHLVGHHGRALLIRSASIPFLQIAPQKYGELACKFIGDIYEGTTVRGEPANLVHQILTRNEMTRGKLKRNYIFALLIKAFNASVRGDKLSMLELKTFEDNEFPKIID